LVSMHARQRSQHDVTVRDSLRASPPDGRLSLSIYGSLSGAISHRLIFS